MPLLILGLAIFLGVHSVRIFADDWRSRQLERIGKRAWKGLYALTSLIGFVLIVWGFGLAREHSMVVYLPPMWLRHLNALLTLVAFVLVVAAYVPRNHLKAAIGHPMLAGVAVWAAGHLLATGRLHDVVLFGAFLLWAVVDFASARRNRTASGADIPATRSGDAVTLIVGVVLWAVFAFVLHGWLIGVRPFV